MLYQILADLVMLVHFAFVLFVIFGLVVVWIGYFAQWQWVRNFGFRLLHLLSMGFVLIEVLIGVKCPLTVWERELRELAGQGTMYAQESFMQVWVHRLLFFDWDQWVFTTLYAGFFALIVLSYILVPPQWKAKASA